MAKLHRAVKKYSIGENVLRKVVGDKTYDEIHPLGTSMVQQDDAAKAAEQAAADAQNKPVIPLPDEEALARMRRRRAQRTTGRDSTMLAGPETFGPS